MAVALAGGRRVGARAAHARAGLDVVERQAGQCAEVGYCLWWWRERDAGELVGYVGLNRDVIDDGAVVEVGWSISPACQRRGFATEAARASLRWGFEVAGLQRIVSLTLPENVASRRVMEAIGMRYVRDFERTGFSQVLYEIEPE